LKGMKVLIAEEEIGVAKLLDVLMKQRGCETDIVADGAQAVELAREAHPDLILLDLMMPIRDGVDVLDELRQDPGTAQIPVVVLTTDETIDQLPDPAMAHVTKPFAPKGLRAAVQQALLPDAQAAG